MTFLNKGFMLENVLLWVWNFADEMINNHNIILFLFWALEQTVNCTPLLKNEQKCYNKYQ